MKKDKKSTGNEEEGDNLWQTVTRGIKAYKNDKARAPKPAPPVRRPKPARETILPPTMLSATPPAKGFDKATAAKLKRGELKLEARLDLHGMTQQQAFDALYRFIHAAVADGKRTVLVITGKGGVTTGGVLKNKLPLWLEGELAPYIVAVTEARPKDGGSGAFYLRLRKSK